MTEKDIRLSHEEQLEVARKTYVELPMNCDVCDIDVYAERIVEMDPLEALTTARSYEGLPSPWSLVVTMYSYLLGISHPGTRSLSQIFAWSTTAEGKKYWTKVNHAAELDLDYVDRSDMDTILANLQRKAPIPKETARLAKLWWKKLGYEDIADEIE